MPENPKTRLARLRKRLAIPREKYLAAVDRQERRAWAYKTDPRRSFDLLTRIMEIKNKYLVADGKEPEPLPDSERVEAPDPAVFDTEEEIKRDEAIIETYLLDTPDERRRPNARGHTHQELLSSWRESPEGKRWQESFSRDLRPKIIEIRDRILAEGS